MQYKDQDGDVAPSAGKPRFIKSNLFRLIAGPNDEQLRERKIGPEHIESEEQFAKVVQMALADDVRERLGVRKHHDRDDHEGHGRDGLSGNEEKTVNSGGPVRRKRHGPIDGG